MIIEGKRVKESPYVKKKKKMIKRFNKISVSIEEKISKYYDSIFAEKIREESKLEFERIIPQIPYYPGKINIFRQIVVIGSWAIAFYKPMKKEEKTVDETILIFYEYVEELHKKIPRIFRWIIRQIFFSYFFFKIAQISARNISKHTEGGGVEYFRKKEEKCDLMLIGENCPIVSFFHDLGVPEMAYYCNFVDYIQSKIFGLGLIQEACFGAGDDKCISCMKKSRNTEVPSNLKNLIEKIKNI